MPCQFGPYDDLKKDTHCALVALVGTVERPGRISAVTMDDSGGVANNLRARRATAAWTVESNAISKKLGLIRGPAAALAETDCDVRRASQLR